jgi:hypothetical protein
MPTAGQMCCLVSDGDRGIEVTKFGGFFARVEIVISLCGRSPPTEKLNCGAAFSQLSLAARSLGFGGPCVLFLSTPGQATMEKATASQRQPTPNSQRLQKRIRATCKQCRDANTDADLPDHQIAGLGMVHIHFLLLPERHSQVARNEHVGLALQDRNMSAE